MSTSSKLYRLPDLSEENNQLFYKPLKIQGDIVGFSFIDELENQTPNLVSNSVILILDLSSLGLMMLFT